MEKNNLKRKALASIGLFLALLMPCSTQATSFIEVYHKGILYVGADTLTVTNGIRSNVCKVTVDGNYLVTAAGLGGVTHPDKTTDWFFDRAAAILRDHLSPSETTEQLREAAKAIISQSGHPSDEDKLLIQVFWFQNNKLWLKFINVRRTLEASGPDEAPIAVPEASVIPSGRQEAYNALYRGHYDLPYAAIQRPKEFIRTLLRRQAKLKPDEVGGPFTIVEFSQRGQLVWEDAHHYCYKS